MDKVYEEPKFVIIKFSAKDMVYADVSSGGGGMSGGEFECD